MAKKLYQIGFTSIRNYISSHKSLINKNIKNSETHELAKVFGRSFYEIAIKDFFTGYKIDRNPKYALQVLNVFKSFNFINNLYVHLELNMFEDTTHVKKLNQLSINDYQKSIFYCFVYFICTGTDAQKEDIKRKVFLHYFLHHISVIIPKTDTYLNYKDMTLSYIKGKNVSIKESYKIDSDSENVNFKILLNEQIKINLDGNSVKTLRKKAYKQVFFYLIDEHKKQSTTNSDFLTYGKN